MAFPTGVNENIRLAKSYFADLVEDYQNDLNIGGCTCNKNVMYTLDVILTALLYKQEEDNYDEIAQNLYQELLEITGVGGNTFILTGYYGYKEDGSILTTEEIEAGFKFNFYKGSNVTVPFSPIDFSRVWFAISYTEPVKTSYVEVSNPDNSGYIGTPYDFMNAPTLVNGVRDYNFYISNYDTSTSAITFRGLGYQYVPISFGYTDINPFGSESVPALQFSIQVLDNAEEYVLDFTNSANLKYLIIKEPSTAPLKTLWENTPIYNEGEIPDTKMRAGVIIGDFRYYVSRVPFALDIETSNITLRT